MKSLLMFPLFITFLASTLVAWRKINFAYAMLIVCRNNPIQNMKDVARPKLSNNTKIGTKKVQIGHNI